MDDVNDVDRISKCRFFERLGNHETVFQILFVGVNESQIHGVQDLNKQSCHCPGRIS